jgi:D-alanyl-D-alanine carboxypeptidase (penicillin-binding protein 5/6)
MKHVQKYFYPFALLCILFISHAAHADAMADRWLANNKVEAPSYILMDLDSGRILAQKNIHQRREPASTTKIMTALLASESGKLDQSFTIGPNPPKTGESSMYLEQGEVFTLRQLVQGTLTKSANDGCVAIAEAVSGTVPKFVQLMNLKAKLLGCHDTHFANPNGLHNPDHYTSANDLALIARAALKDPFFDATVRIKKIILHGNKKIPLRVFYNHNRLLMHWEKCDGVKTGYTHQAGRCLVASATQLDPTTGHKWRLLSVVLHAPNCWSDSINLLQHRGFDLFHPVRVAEAGKVLATVKIKGAGAAAEAVPANDLWLPLRSGEEKYLKATVHPLQRSAPLAKGQIVAYISWTENGHKIAAMPLVANDDVNYSTIYRAMNSLKSLGKNGPIYKSIWVWIGLALLFIFTVFKVNAGKRKRARKKR